MKKWILCLGLLALSPSAFATSYGYVWASMSAPNQNNCFPINSSGKIVKNALPVDLSKCFYSYAWAPSNNSFQCFAITEGGTFLPNANAAGTNHCARAYVWATDSNGQTHCFGTGPDGEVASGIWPAADINCNN